MGRLLLVGRLAARDLRRRPAEAALLLLAITAATTTLTLGLVLHGVTSQPYQRPGRRPAGPTWWPASLARPARRGPPNLAGLESADARSPASPATAGRTRSSGATLAAHGHDARRRRRRGATPRRPRSTSPS